MNSLQQLLDEKFPITKETTEEGKRLYLMCRDIFTEGYNAAKEEKKPVLEGRDAILAKCAEYYKSGMSLAAVKHYKDNTGCDLMTAIDTVGPKSVFALNLKN